MGIHTHLKGKKEERKIKEKPANPESRTKLRKEQQENKNKGTPALSKLHRTRTTLAANPIIDLSCGR